METTTKLIQIFPPVTGQGKNGEWSKTEFLTETDGQYPKKVIFTAWGDKAELLPKPGATIKIKFDAESREYNGRWYTELKMFGCEVVGAAQAAPAQTFSEPTAMSSAPVEDDLPF